MHERTILRSAGLMFIVALLGCASHQRAAVAERARSEMVGMSKADLLACTGAPLRTASADDIEVLTYAGGGDGTSAAVANTSGSATTAAGVSHRHYCEVSFVLKGGVVARVNYAGRTGGLLTKGEQCAFVVENCVAEK
jgi:hypothetical protein